jgi:hypothetical protein
MRPPKMSIDEYCACPDGRHVHRFLPVPETPEERALIAAYDSAYIWPDLVDLTEAIERFTRDGATAENMTWASGFEDRSLDRRV